MYLNHFAIHLKLIVEINYTSIKKKTNNLIEKWAKGLNTSSKRRYRWQVST